jgi:NRAMP (natural resistance-associated macrophage protein)-like metal ion transporter
MIKKKINEKYETVMDKIVLDIHTKTESGHFPVHPRQRFWWIIGPGLLSGTSGNDPSAISAYAEDGAIVGYGHLWLILLSTLFYQAVQFACAKIGRISQKGLPSLLREHYGRPIAIFASLLLIITNVTLIGADLAAIGSGLQLIIGTSYTWFIIPTGLVLWYLTVYYDFEAFKKTFLFLSLVSIAYILTSFVSHVDWKTVLTDTCMPQFDFTFNGISSAVALLGATISPYSMFWQTQGEIEQRRLGSLRQQVYTAKIDVASGTISGNLIAYFIIVSTSATLYAHHMTITTAAEAAHALEPLAGPLAGYLFALGLIGSGLVAIPVLLVSTSYAVVGAADWPSGFSKCLSQAKGFYTILTSVLVVGMSIALLKINPIHLIFWANVVAAIMAPPLVTAILLIGNNRKIMKGQCLSLLHNIGLVLIILILIGAVSLLLYSMATGQGS